jgi:probable F420-dependent oxidoreductase
MSGGPDSASFLHDYVVRAERLGFDSLWTWERLLRAVDPRTPYGGASSSYAATKEMPDTQKNVMAPTEVMAAIAAWTERARIGVAIMVMGFANPVALAKRLATVDVLSGGRLVAGLGLGWSEDEHIAGGVEYATRGARSEEFIEVLTKCWKEDPVTHAGRFFQVPSAFIGPKPIQQPRPPLVFGLWSKPGLARTARLADGWTTGGGTTLSDVLAARDWMNAQRPAGRPPLTIHYRLFLQLPIPRRSDLSTSEVLDEIAKAQKAGIDEVIVDPTYSRWSSTPDGWHSFLEATSPALEFASA